MFLFFSCIRLILSSFFLDYHCVLQVQEKGGFAKKLFNIVYKRRLAAIEGSWFGAWGLERMLWDAIVFKSIRDVLGGRIRFILCGGAPLSAESQRFVNICMG